MKLKTISFTRAKRSQHFNPRYRNIVGRNMLDAFRHPVSTTFCNMLRVVSSSLKMAKIEPTTLNTLQQDGQTRAASCTQQCFHMA